MRINDELGIMFDEVGLEQDSLAANGKSKFPQGFEQYVREISLIVYSWANGYAGGRAFKRWPQIGYGEAHRGGLSAEASLFAA
jgi:hypothetical protein